MPWKSAAPERGGAQAAAAAAGAAGVVVVVPLRRPGEGQGDDANGGSRVWHGRQVDTQRATRPTPVGKERSVVFGSGV